MNICSTCGGGINDYTAPEARCRCYSKDQKKIESLAHEVKLAESRWLTACGWIPVDIKTRQEGFIWMDEKRQGPFTHEEAVRRQKLLDSDPTKKKQFDLELRHQRVYERREEKSRKGQDISIESGELCEIINMMSSLQNQKSG